MLRHSGERLLHQGFHPDAHLSLCDGAAAGGIPFFEHCENVNLAMCQHLTYLLAQALFDGIVAFERLVSILNRPNRGTETWKNIR